MGIAAPSGEAMYTQGYLLNYAGLTWGSAPHGALSRFEFVSARRDRPISRFISFAGDIWLRRSKARGAPARHQAEDAGAEAACGGLSASLGCPTRTWKRVQHDRCRDRRLSRLPLTPDASAVDNARAAATIHDPKRAASHNPERPDRWERG